MSEIIVSYVPGFDMMREVREGILFFFFFFNIYLFDCARS